MKKLYLTVLMILTTTVGFSQAGSKPDSGLVPLSAFLDLPARSTAVKAWVGVFNSDTAVGDYSFTSVDVGTASLGKYKSLEEITLELRYSWNGVVTRSMSIDSLSSPVVIQDRLERYHINLDFVPGKTDSLFEVEWGILHQSEQVELVWYSHGRVGWNREFESPASRPELDFQEIQGKIVATEQNRGTVNRQSYTHSTEVAALLPLLSEGDQWVAIVKQLNGPELRIRFKVLDGQWEGYPLPTITQPAPKDMQFQPELPENSDLRPLSNTGLIFSVGYSLSGWNFENREGSNIFAKKPLDYMNVWSLDASLVKPLFKSRFVGLIGGGFDFVPGFYKVTLHPTVTPDSLEMSAKMAIHVSFGVGVSIKDAKVILGTRIGTWSGLGRIGGFTMITFGPFSFGGEVYLTEHPVRGTMNAVGDKAGTEVLNHGGGFIGVDVLGLTRSFRK